MLCISILYQHKNQIMWVPKTQHICECNSYIFVKLLHDQSPRLEAKVHTYLWIWIRFQSLLYAALGVQKKRQCITPVQGVRNNGLGLLMIVKVWTTATILRLDKKASRIYAETNVILPQIYAGWVRKQCAGFFRTKNKKLNYFTKFYLQFNQKNHESF